MDEQENTPQENGVNLPLEKDAVPVCPNCLESCNPLDYYCPHCGSNEAINPLASYLPFIDLRLRIGMIGKLWRKTWAAQTPFFDRAIYIGLIFLFFPLLLLVGIPVVIFEKLKSKKESPLESPDSE